MLTIFGSESVPWEPAVPLEESREQRPPIIQFRKEGLSQGLLGKFVPILSYEF
jgi:hypothetical protein